jgi:hypothetical protein
MTCERNLGTNGPSSAMPRLNEGAQERLTGFLVLAAVIDDVFSARDKIFPRLFAAERIPDHMGVSRPSASGSRSRTQLFDQSVPKVDESSSIPDQFISLKQIGNLPDKARPAQPARRPGPAGRRAVARTCGGGAQAPVGLAPPYRLRTPPRGTPGPRPRPASMGKPSLFPGWGEFLQGRGDPEGSARRNPRLRCTCITVNA